MSKVNPVTITNLTEMSDLTRFLQPFCSQVSSALANGLNFQDNFVASRINVSFPSVANQNIQISHGLGTTPIGYIPIQTSAACSIYNGISLVLGATFANLMCNTAGITATILFF